MMEFSPFTAESIQRLYTRILAFRTVFFGLWGCSPLPHLHSKGPNPVNTGNLTKAAKSFLPSGKTDLVSNPSTTESRSGNQGLAGATSRTL